MRKAFKCQWTNIAAFENTTNINLKAYKKVNAEVSHGAVNMQLIDMRVMLERLISNPSLFNDLDGGLGCGGAQFEFFFT